MTEKRESPRRNVETYQASAVVKRANGTTVEGEVVDMSLNGARIIGPVGDLQVGEEVEVLFQFRDADDTENVPSKCRVMHLDTEGKFFGISFVEDSRINPLPKLQSD